MYKVGLESIQKSTHLSFHDFGRVTDTRATRLNTASRNSHCFNKMSNNCFNKISIALHNKSDFVNHPTNIPLPYDSLPFMAICFGDINSKVQAQLSTTSCRKIQCFPPHSRGERSNQQDCNIPTNPPKVYSVLLCVFTAQTCYHSVNVQLTGISQQAGPDLTLNASTLGKRILTLTVKHKK